MIPSRNSEDDLARLYNEWEADAIKDPDFDNYHFEGAQSFRDFLEERLGAEKGKAQS